MSEQEWAEWFYYRKRPDGNFVLVDGDGDYYNGLYTIEENIKFDVALSNMWHNTKTIEHYERMHMWDAVVSIIHERGLVI